MANNRFGLHKAAVVNFAIRVFGAGLSFLVGILLARTLGAAGFGEYSVLVAAINLAATLAAFGWPQVVAREIASEFARGNLAKISKVLRVSLFWVIFGSALVSAIGIYVTHADLLIMASQPASWSIAVLLIPVISLNLFRSAVLKGFHEVQLADFPELIVRPGVILLCLSLIMYLGGGLDSYFAVGLYSVGTGISFMVGILNIFFSPIRPVLSNGSWSEGNRWLKESMVFFFITIICMLEMQVPIYLLGCLGGFESAGLYQAANQIVSIVIMGLAAVNLSLQPKVVAAWSKGNHTEVQYLVKTASRFGILGALGAVAILFSFSETILRVLGDKYIEASGVLNILLLAQLVNAFVGPCGLLLTATGHELLALYGRLASLLVTLALCIFLIPDSSIQGASIAVLSGTLTWNLILAILAKHKLNIYTPAI